MVMMIVKGGGKKHMKVVMRWAMMKVGLVMKMTKHIGPVGSVSETEGGNSPYSCTDPNCRDSPLELDNSRLSLDENCLIRGEN